MRLFDELKNETNDIVLVDTDVFINLEHHNCHEIEYLFTKYLFNFNNKPFLTDVSFCELIIGCRKLDDYLFHLSELKKMEFLICGTYTPLCNFLSSFDFEALNSLEQLNDLRNKLIDLRNNFLFPFYYQLFRLYVIICMCVFNENDKTYWWDAFHLFNNFLINNKKEFKNILYDSFMQYVDDKNESKNLVKSVFSEMVITLLVLQFPKKYTRIELEEKISYVLSAKCFSALFKKWNIKHDTSDKNWLVKGFVTKIRKIIDYYDETPVQTDGLCFVLSRIIFNDANFNSHDLIDLYNISFSTENIINIHYFTSDYKKWIDFIEIEKELRPDIKINFNN